MSPITRVLLPTSTFPRWKNDTEPSFVFDLCKEIARYNIEVTVIAPHAPGAKTEEIMDGIKIYRYRYFLENFQTLAYRGGILSNLRANPVNYLLVPFFLTAQFFFLRKHLKTEWYDVIHAHWIIPQGLVSVLAANAVYNKNIPMVCTVHGSDLHALQGRVFKLITRYVIRNTAALCPVSNALKNSCLALGAEPGKTEVISMGVDLQGQFVPNTEIRRKEERIVFVGRLVEEKGVEILIDAIALVKERIPNIELLIVGEGPEQGRLQHYAMARGVADSIVFRGAVAHSHLPPLYNAASIFVLPSRREGLGLGMIEAMGCECAVVASELDSIKDAVVHGQTGYLVEPGNAADMAKTLVCLLSDRHKRQDVARRGREYALQRYDWSQIGVKYSTLLHSLAAAETDRE